MSNRFPDHNPEAMPADLQDIYARLSEDGAAFRAPPPATLRLEQLIDTLASPLSNEEYTMQPATQTTARNPQAEHPAPRRKRWLSSVSAIAAVVLLAVLAQLIFTNLHRSTPGAKIKVSPTVNAHPSVTADMLFSVSMVSPTEGWAVGSHSLTSQPPTPSSALLYHYLNGAWSPVYVLQPSRSAKISMPVINAVAMVSATDGWAVGGYNVGRNTGFMLHYDGTGWKQIGPQTSSPFVTVQMLSATDGWAVAGGSPEIPLSIYHFDGQAWSRFSTPPIAGFASLQSLAMTSPTDGWLAAASLQHPVGQAPMALLLHYQAGTWSLAASIANFEPAELSMSTATDGWIAGLTRPVTTDEQMALLHYTNGQWELVASPVGRSANGPLALHFNAPNDGWLSYDPLDDQQTSQIQALHFDGQTWHAVQMPILTHSFVANLTSFAFTSPAEGWATGYKIWPDSFGLPYGKGIAPLITPIFLHYQNGVWTVVQG